MNNRGLCQRAYGRQSQLLCAGVSWQLGSQNPLRWAWSNICLWGVCRATGCLDASPKWTETFRRGGGRHQTYRLPFLPPKAVFPPVGLERNGDFPGKSTVSPGRGANRGALNWEDRITPLPSRDADPDLKSVVDRWHSFPTPARAAVLAVLAALPIS